MTQVGARRRLAPTAGWRRAGRGEVPRPCDRKAGPAPQRIETGPTAGWMPRSRGGCASGFPECRPRAQGEFWPRGEARSNARPGIHKAGPRHADYVLWRVNISTSTAETVEAVLGEIRPNLRTKRCRSTARSWSSATCPRLP